MTSGFDINGKVAVITGGGNGIGLATGRKLGHAGAMVILADIEEERVEAAADALRAEGIVARGKVADVTNLASVECLANYAWEEFGRVNILVNNAGVGVVGPTQDMEIADWEWVLGVNLWGAIHGVHAFVTKMIASKEAGHLVFVSSFAGLVPNRALGPYNVAKAAVVALAESLHKDLYKKEIGVSVLCPMRVATNIDASARNRPQSLGGQDAPQPYQEEWLSSLVDQRTLEPSAVAEIVAAGIRQRELYLHTHPEAEAPIRMRADRIVKAFSLLDSLDL